MILKILLNERKLIELMLNWSSTLSKSISKSICFEVFFFFLAVVWFLVWSLFWASFLLAYGILASGPGVEPIPLEARVKSPNR